jgi:glycerol uptake facilitator-like aquaporin
MMKPALFLRIAAVLTLIHAVLHTIGGVFGTPQPGPATVAVMAMKTNQFLMMGHSRNYWDFYRGFGLAISIVLTAEAIVFWQLGSLAKTDARRLRPILATFLVGYAALAVNSYTYFFLAPVITELLIAASLALAIAAAKPQAAPQAAASASQT